MGNSLMEIKYKIPVNKTSFIRIDIDFDFDSEHIPSSEDVKGKLVDILSEVKKLF